MSVKSTIYVCKRPEFDTAGKQLFQDLRDNLEISGLSGVRIFNRYEIRGVPKPDIEAAIPVILSEPPLDEVYVDEFPHETKGRILGVEFLPGQYDQRADSTAQCFQIFSLGDLPEVATARFFLLEGDITQGQFERIRKYLVNPVDSRQTTLAHSSLGEKSQMPPSKVPVVKELLELSEEGLENMLLELNLSMSKEDLRLIQIHFRKREKRPPTLTEIRMLDTYWSDHCRHTTFRTKLAPVQFEDGPYADMLANAFTHFRNEYHAFPEAKGKDPTLMDIATMSMRTMLGDGRLNDMEVSGEINACSIIRSVRESDSHREWLIMFKNETHNHPTEIEPFGGAATCLGGAIRDPLSGRAYVYQAMRVTGCGDPRTPVSQTLEGKLPQRKITTEAALGYSSYGNQIGLATGLVREVYHPGYTAKRMEVGAVIGAVPREHVIRMEPATGDRILLVGGRTGRDGIGGATGSSKGHTEDSLSSAGAEVQKGNPPEERKLQRLFRNPEVIGMIKKCNDFGAGGVSVAVGELAKGIDLFLDRIPLKYQGLNGTELALSESQERMAVVVSPEDVSRFIDQAAAENLDATEIAQVTDTDRLRMFWRDKAIVDLDREFLDSNGAPQRAAVLITSPDKENSFFEQSIVPEKEDLESTWISLLEDLNVCSQIGLVEQFDSSIGAASVHLPLGGRFQETPADAMVARIPTLEGETLSATAMSFGFNPRLSTWSPFHGGVFAVVEALARLVAVGVDYRSVRLSLQEYFEKPGNVPARWGKPLSALLGAHTAMSRLNVPAIGGKDSMSGSFNELDVPPTLIAFSVGTLSADQAVSSEFKAAGNHVYLIPAELDGDSLPRFDLLGARFHSIHKGIQSGQILSARAVGAGGLAESATKMCLGNRIGFEFDNRDHYHRCFAPGYGAFLVEIKAGPCPAWLTKAGGKKLGTTLARKEISGPGLNLPLSLLRNHWMASLEPVFKTRSRPEPCATDLPPHPASAPVRSGKKFVRPRVLIPVFPGTNCEYDTLAAVQKAGGHPKTTVFTNRSSQEITHSLETLSEEIEKAQIVILPGGFSAGDEPEGSGKFIATIFRNPRIRESVNRLIHLRDGLILGICNGFQALIKLGLVPYGEIRDISPQSPTITYNCIGRHVSRMAWTRVLSSRSPWLSNCRPGEIHTVPVSHGEGRVVASEDLIRELSASGQIATQYVDPEGNPTMEYPYNPNGAVYAIEGITSPDGRVFGKMGHSERMGPCVAANIPGISEPDLFEAGISYFS